jgi:hypothetical protein
LDKVFSRCWIRLVGVKVSGFRCRAPELRASGFGVGGKGLGILDQKVLPIG